MFPDLSSPDLIDSDTDYAWELATMFPAQGEWSEDAYLDLTDGTNRRIELVDGRLEFLPMPTELHQALAEYLYHALRGFVLPGKLGKVAYGSLRVRIRERQVREPDVLYVQRENYHLRANRNWSGADLVMEVVSPDAKDKKRDYEDKLIDYAEVGIAEYWIVDPQENVVIVHHLQDSKYEVLGEHRPGETAASKLLDGFSIDVTDLFAVADDVPE